MEDYDLEEDIRDLAGKSEIQGLLKTLANAYGDKEGRGYLHKYNAINILRSIVTDEPLEKAWKEKYKDNIQKLQLIGQKIANINFFFTQTQKNKKEEDPTTPNFMRYRKLYAEILGESQILYEAFHILLHAHPTIKHLSIPHEYWTKTEEKKDDKKT